MRKRTPMLEWQIVDQQGSSGDVPWPPVVEATPSAPETERTSRRILWSGVLMLLLLLTVTGGWLWQRAEAGLDQIEGELSSTVQVELESLAPSFDAVAASWDSDSTPMIWADQFKRERDSLQSFLRPDRLVTERTATKLPTVEYTTTIETITLRDDRAVANFVTTTMDGREVTRQARFYRNRAEGWQRTAPDATLWGSSRSLESTHFVFHYRQNDAEVVARVAPQIEALYSVLLRNFGLTSHVEKMVAGKLVIEVSVERTTATPVTPAWVLEPLVVPSPAIYLAPAEVSDDEILAQSIAIPMIDYMAMQAIKVHAVPVQWWPLLQSMKLWQLWEGEMPLAAWRDDVVVWLYGAIPVDGPEQDFILPEKYAELCAMHGLWMLWPHYVGIPLKCYVSDEEMWGSTRWPTQLQIDLDQLKLPRNEYDRNLDAENDRDRYSRVALTATLIEYAVATYGHEKLPQLLAALGRHDNLDSLIREVFSVSATEFEQGWRAYVGKEYGLKANPLQP